VSVSVRPRAIGLALETWPLSQMDTLLRRYSPPNLNACFPLVQLNVSPYVQNGAVFRDGVK
jgi:hypothetical protein